MKSGIDTLNSKYMESQPSLVEGFQLAMQEKLSNTQRDNLVRDIQGYQCAYKAFAMAGKNSQSVQSVAKFAMAGLDIYLAALTCGPVGAFATAAVSVFSFFMKADDSFQQFATTVLANLKYISEQIYQVYLEEKNTQTMLLNGFNILHEDLRQISKSIYHGFTLINQKLDCQHAITNCHILVNTQLALSNYKSSYELLEDKIKDAIDNANAILEGSITENIQLEVTKATRELIKCIGVNKRTTQKTLTGKHFFQELDKLDAYEFINTVLNNLTEEKLNDVTGFIAEYITKELRVTLQSDEDNEEMLQAVFNPQLQREGFKAYFDLAIQYVELLADPDNINLQKIKRAYELNLKRISGYQVSQEIYGELFSRYKSAIDQIKELIIAAIQLENQKLSEKFGQPIDLLSMGIHAIINLCQGEFLPDMPISPGSFTCLGQALSGDLQGLAYAQNYPSFRQSFYYPCVDPLYIALMKLQLISVSASAGANIETSIYSGNHQITSFANVYAHINKNVYHIIHSQRKMNFSGLGIEPTYVGPSISQRNFGAGPGEQDLPGAQADEAYAQGMKLLNSNLLSRIVEAIQHVMHSPIFIHALNKLDACKRLLFVIMRYAGFRGEEFMALDKLWDSSHVSQHLNNYIASKDFSAPLPHTTLANSESIAKQIISHINPDNREYFKSSYQEEFNRAIAALEALAQLRNLELKPSNEISNIEKIFKNYRSKFEIWSHPKYQKCIPDPEKSNESYSELIENIKYVKLLIAQINGQLQLKDNNFLQSLIDQMEMLITKCNDIHVALKFLSPDYTFTSSDFCFLGSDRKAIESIKSSLKIGFFKKASTTESTLRQNERSWTP